MTEEELKYIASQLRKPSGEHGIEVGEKLSSSNAELYHNTLEVLELKEGDSVLEIGMGMATHVKEIINAQENIQYLGCDYSEVMVSQSRQVNKAFIEQGAVEFICADVTHLPLKSNSYSIILTVNTIYFWDKLDRSLAELHRVLKPNGKIIIAGRPKHILEAYPFTSFGFRLFDKKELNHILLKHGFVDVNCIEKKEEARDINGKLYDIESLIFIGVKG